VKAWTDMIGLKNVPISQKELKRLENLAKSESDAKKRGKNRGARIKKKDEPETPSKSDKGSKLAA